MTKTILQWTVKGARRGRQKKRLEGNFKEWTGMGFEDSLRAAEDMEGWKGIVASVVPRRSLRLRDCDEMISNRTVQQQKLSIESRNFGYSKYRYYTS